MLTWFHPKLDITLLLQDEEINFYQSQISILCWMVKLGRVDIYVNVAILSTFLASPREGHLEAVYSIHGYLKSHNRSNMVFDPSYVNWKREDSMIGGIFMVMLVKIFQLMHLFREENQCKSTYLLTQITLGINLIVVHKQECCFIYIEPQYCGTRKHRKPSKPLLLDPNLSHFE